MSHADIWLQLGELMASPAGLNLCVWYLSHNRLSLFYACQCASRCWHAGIYAYIGGATCTWRALHD